jgi:hypothetical protein
VNRHFLSFVVLSVTLVAMTVAWMWEPEPAISADTNVGARAPASAAETWRVYLGRPALITQVRGNETSRWHGILRTIEDDWVAFDVVENAEQNPTPLGRSVLVKTADVTQIEVLMASGATR